MIEKATPIHRLKLIIFQSQDCLGRLWGVGVLIDLALPVRWAKLPDPADRKKAIYAPEMIVGRD